VHDRSIDSEVPNSGVLKETMTNIQAPSRPHAVRNVGPGSAFGRNLQVGDSVFWTPPNANSTTPTSDEASIVEP
jgi:hypothetical protein